jgi:hypothetical protein
LLFCLPDMLWYTALLILQKQFYNKGGANKILFCLAVLLPFIFEFLQYLNYISGTFDILDIITYSLTFLIILTIWNRKKIKKFYWRNYC